MVYYRKYRPQLISELDLDSIRLKLTSILSSQNIPHAFLFTGSKGLGKTSSARILAKAINCENRNQELAKKKNNANIEDQNAKNQNSFGGSNLLTIEPCNKCLACISITNGSNVDVLEIDAASNRGIDEIRDLRERIKYSPSRLKKKIYIIDEVHMLTSEAFNALLKTLEEPPEHVIFILATTETQKLPATILSRVFVVNFEKPTSQEILRSLKRIVEGENLVIDSDALEKVATLSDGAFRDGAKILEELALSSKNKKITLELLESIYKTGSIDSASQNLINYTLKNDLKKALDEIKNLEKQNVDFKIVIENMAGILHSKVLALALQDNKGEISSIMHFLELLDVAYKNLRGAVLPQLPLEIAVIEYLLGKKNSQDEDTKKIETLKKDSTDLSVKVENAAKSPDDNFSQLKELINKVNVENKILAGLLRGCFLEVSEKDMFILKAPSEFHAGKLNEKKNLDVLERILGKRVAIEFKN